MEVSEALRTGIGVTLSEALAYGGMTAVIGMSIVFGVLVVLMLVLYLFKVIFYKGEKKTKKPVQEIQVTSVVEETEEAEDEDELIAVLTAAIAASLNTSTYNLNIKSYRRIGNNRPEWNKAGLKDTIGNRF